MRSNGSTATIATSRFRRATTRLPIKAAALRRRRPSPRFASETAGANGAKWEDSHMQETLYRCRTCDDVVDQETGECPTCADAHEEWLDSMERWSEREYRDEDAA
jgi:hypothetical protein